MITDLIVFNPPYYILFSICYICFLLPVYSWPILFWITRVFFNMIFLSLGCVVRWACKFLTLSFTSLTNSWLSVRLVKLLYSLSLHFVLLPINIVEKGLRSCRSLWPMAASWCLGFVMYETGVNTYLTELCKDGSFM